MRDLDNHFGEYAHLQHFQRPDEALQILRKVASCVKPIMRKRGWQVGTLSEFFPNEPNLWGLNVNYGQRINVRLRHAADVNQFVPFEQVLDTMLHELSHNVFGPHDDKFHRLWDELREEWRTLQSQGYTGEGFLGKGRAIGGRRIPVDEIRRQARVAAEKRSKQTSEVPRVLGGAAVGVGRRDIRAVIADAATRRAAATQRSAGLKTSAVNSGCGTGTRVGDIAAQDALKNGFRTKAEMDDANDVAIAQALAGLMQEEEETNIVDTAASNGLTWSPEQGLQLSLYPASKNTYVPPAKQPPPYDMSRGTRQLPSSNSVSPANNISKGRAASSMSIQQNPRGKPVSRLVLEAEIHKKSIKSPRSSSSSPSLSRNLNSDSQTFTPREPWSCLTCTLTNEASTGVCAVCETRRPSLLKTSHGRPTYYESSASASTLAASKDEPLGWVCMSCSNFMERQWWSCSHCGAVKSHS